jgi:hypothetical protein
MIQGVSGFRRRQCAKADTQEGTNAPTQQGTSAQTDGRPFSISHSCVWRFALKRTSESSAHLQIARMSGSFLGSNLALAAIAFVTPIVIGRGLGPGQFGRWIFFTAWAFTLTVAFDRRDAEAAPRDGRHKTRGRRPVPVDDVEEPITLQRTHKRGVLRRQPTGTSEVVYHRAEQGMAAGTTVVAKHVHRQIVPSCLTLDEPQQRRNDPLASASIDAVRHDERKARERPSCLLVSSQLAGTDRVYSGSDW